MSRKKEGKVNKLIRFVFFVFLFALGILVALNYLPKTTYAIEVQDNGYELQISHENANENGNQGQLFNIMNMAPSEEYTEVLTLKNMGSDRFYTHITATNTSTQENLLFNSLDLLIREGSPDGEVIFDGKLKDLKDIVLCPLGKENSKKYYMTLSLPAESGNEYQSKSAGFKFVITAAADMPNE